MNFELNPNAYTGEATRVITARVSVETQRQLRELSAANDISVSKLITKAVEALVAAHY